MPSGNAENQNNDEKSARPQYVWETRAWNALILAVASVAGGFSFDNHTDVANLQDQIVNVVRLEQQVLSHITGHPDTNLSRRADRQQSEIDRLEERVRQLEIDQRNRQKYE